MQMPRLVFGETSRERELRAENERLQAEANKLRDEANDWFGRCREARRELDTLRGVNQRAVAALGAKFEEAIVERDEARRERDSHAVRLRAAELERDEVKLLLASEEEDGNEMARRLKEVELERDRARDERDYVRRQRDEALRDRDEHASRLKVAEAERDEARRERDEARGSRVALRVECIRSCRYRLRELIDRHDDVDRRLAEANEAVAGWRHIAEQILRSGGGDGSYKTADDIEPTTESPEDRPAKDSGAEGAGTTPE